MHKQGRSKLRWALGLLAALVLIALLGFLALKRAYPPERLLAMVAEQVQAKTGREFAIRGPISWRLLPNIAVVVEDLHLANLDWGSRPEMLSIRKAALELALEPLLDGRIEVQRILIEGADIWLEVDEQGRGNWAFSPSQSGASLDSKSKPKPQGKPGDFSLAHIQWADSKITLHSPRMPRDLLLHIDELNLHAQQADYALQARLSLAEQPLRIDGSFGGLAAFRAESEFWPFDLKLQLEGLNLSSKGQLALGVHAGDFNVELKAALSDSQALQALMPRRAELFRQLPQALQLDAQVRRQGALLSVQPFKIAAAGQSMEGELFERGGQPLRLEMKLKSDSLDLAPFLLQPKGQSSKTQVTQKSARTTQVSGPVFSRDSWPLPKAFPFELDLALDIRSLQLPKMPPMQGLLAQVEMATQSLNLKSAQWQMAGGQWQASAGMDLPALDAGKTAKAGAAQTGAKPPSWRLKLDGRDIKVDDLAPYLSSASPPALRGGALRMAIDVAAKGDDAREWVSSLEGQVLLDARNFVLQGQAKHLGTDVLTGTLRALLPGDQKRRDNPIRCAVMRLPFKQGRADIDRSIALESEQFNLAALGHIDLGKETLSLSMRPSTQKGLGVSAANLSALVQLEGPLNQPNISWDAAGTAQQATQVGLKLATGGLSILAQRLLSKPEPAEQPCRRALNPDKSAGPTLRNWLGG
ncbi:AsmA family protein [Paucibacter sp. Y2R2-4]|uniref:AsmA family protein n=1 Tax=Paucibacter sp. Y2R2-4 TaxID=2893553 RepID=UPI0021E433D9|nr:AsmA family protein [Paucibacter sp. Y2R2-4]MCV2348238.1 AsmA family protein [Paucibacter sp. Y2R2-4]